MVNQLAQFKKGQSSTMNLICMIITADAS